MTIAIVKFTTYLSIFIQLVTGIFGTTGIFYKLPQPHTILVDALKIEMLVQFIEMFFYIILILRFNIDSMAKVRYYDWFITTPTMLFTTIIVYKYIQTVDEDKNLDAKLTIKQFIKDHYTAIAIIVAANFMMLLFGYLGETGALSVATATALGFVSLGVTPYVIYTNFGKYLIQNKLLFYLLVVIWSLYGVIYIFPNIYKNISYNFLDIVAKNFFGLYLFYKIRKIHKEKMKNNKQLQ